MQCAHCKKTIRSNQQKTTTKEDYEKGTGKWWHVGCFNEIKK